LLKTGIADTIAGHPPVQRRHLLRGGANIKRSLVILLTAVLLLHLAVSRYAAG
jgi:hypothetical protein